MKRRLLLAAFLLAAAALVWMLARSLPPVPLTAQFIRWTNYPSGRIACVLAVTNVSTNYVTMLLPMEFASNRNISTTAAPPILWFCSVTLPPQTGQVAPFVRTEAHSRKTALHYGERINSPSVAFRIRRWLHLRLGQPRDFLSKPRTLFIEVPPE